MKPDFVEYLKDHVVLGDGALGSYLYEKGIERGRNLDLLNLQAADFVFSAHEEYIRAGSQLIETNTFGANHFRLREVGAQHRVGEINRAGAGIAAAGAVGKQFYLIFTHAWSLPFLSVARCRSGSLLAASKLSMGLMRELPASSGATMRGRRERQLGLSGVRVATRFFATTT